MRFCEIKTQKTGVAAQATGKDKMPKAKLGRTKHPLHGKLVGENLEGDALYAKLIKQQFPMGAGYELHAGMTHEMWYKELKLANRWLAAAVRAGEIKPPVSIGNDFTIRDKTGQNIGIPGQWDPSMKPKSAKPVNESKVHLKEGARIEHLEDLVFRELPPSKGANRALQSLINLEQGGHEDVTVKWDGSPAIIFGRDSDGNFVFTDKSGFTAKGYDGRAKSAKDLEKMLMNRPGANNPDPKKAEDYKAFAGRMADIFDEYEKATPKDYRGFFKGDLLYFNTPVTEGGDYVFKPNIVEYRVKQDSELGKKIGASKTGIVIHREVDADGKEGPLRNADILQGEEVLIIPPVTVSSAPELDDTSIKELKAIISKDAAAMDNLLDISTLTQLKLKKLPEVFYAYMNSKVDTGMENLGADFIEWVQSRNQLSEAAKQKIAQYVSDNQQGFNALWEVVAKIQEVKDDVINQLDNQPGAPVKQSMSSIDDSAEGGEGYVLAHPEGDIKLVPRQTFSKYNRAVAR